MCHENSPILSPNDFSMEENSGIDLGICMYLTRFAHPFNAEVRVPSFEVNAVLVNNRIVVNEPVNYRLFLFISPLNPSLLSLSQLTFKFTVFPGTIFIPLRISRTALFFSFQLLKLRNSLLPLTKLLSAISASPRTVTKAFSSHFLKTAPLNQSFSVFRAVAK